VAVLAGALSSGAGISTADATTTPTGADTLQSGDGYNWKLHNHTGQPINGTWDLTMPATGNSSHVKATADHPWAPGDTAGATMYKNNWNSTVIEGDICYNKHRWTYSASFSTTNFTFGLEVDSAGALWVYPWSDTDRSSRVPMKLDPDSTC
ncbi:hypothetical protein R3Q06_33995, partial [Rhodococcus erythropolis]|uniref:hypothetical protein n=1 Tax=Rhodococcus erythropolis TaxID=1833 RepID=UPI0029496F24